MTEAHGVTPNRQGAAAARRRAARWLAVIVGLALFVGPAVAVRAAESVPPPAPAMARALGGDRVAGVVAFADLLAATRAGRVKAALVDERSGWALAADGRGRVVAARLPQVGADHLGKDPSADSGARPAELLADAGAVLVPAPE